MFKLTNLSNTIYENSYQGIPIALINNSIGGVPISKIQLSENTIYDNRTTEVIITNTVTNVGEELIINVDINITGITNIVINGIIYTYNVNNVPGTYYFNSATNQLIIRPSTTVLPNTFISIYGTSSFGLDDQIKDFNYYNLIRIEGFSASNGIIDYFNIKGTITINQNYNDYPTTNLSIIASNLEINSFRNIIKNTDTKWIIANVPFRVQSFTETIAKQEQYPSGYIEINITFEGWYKRLLDKTIFIRNRVDLKENEYECNIENEQSLLNQETINPEDNTTFIVSLKTLGNRAGVNIIGEDINVKYPLDTPGNLVTTLSSAISTILSERPDIYFLYSKLDGIHIIKWSNPRSHPAITESTIISELQNGYNLDSNIKYIYPTYLTWNNKKTKSERNKETNKNTSKPEYEPIQYKKEISEEGDINYNVPYVNKLDSLNYNYDVSGRTKTYIKNTFEGSNIIKIESQIWGFVYDSSDIGYFDSRGVHRLNSLASPYWRCIEKKTTEYTYDTVTGYLLGTRSSGYKYLRYRQETDEEHQVAMLRDEGGDALREVFMYTWFQQPLTESTTYKLVQFADFYSDYQINPEDQYTVYTYCDRFGKLHAGYVLNPNFVYPRFAIETKTIYDCYSEANNPLNSALESGDVAEGKLKTGEYRKINQKLKIRRTPNTKEIPATLSKFLYGNTSVDYINKEIRDSYIIYETKQQSGDSDFKNNTENTTSSINEGIPSEHTKRSPRYKLKEDGTLKEKEKRKKETEETSYEYIVYTDPYTGTEQVSNTKFYNVDTLEEAKKYFELDYEKSLFNNTSNNSLVCLYRNNIYEGEVISYNYNNESISNFRIKNITKTFNLKGEGLITGYISFNGNNNYLDNDIKKDIKLEITKSKRLKKKDKPNLELTILLPPYHEGSILE